MLRGDPLENDSLFVAREIEVLKSSKTYLGHLLQFEGSVV
jgi:hypothetical protein